ncbi:MAG TPA: J domain-containing protein, partial [Methylovirgula sp.]|nr:J domain-containing protein [Methylovirgula sp.]
AMTATAYPLEWPEGWPRTLPDKRPNGSPFKTTLDRALEALLEELGRLKASGVVISSWLPLRADGFPRSDVARFRIEDPGVAVYFMRGGRQLFIARDAYWNVHDNLRSIGLAIEHLRGLERHGGAHLMERAFSGFVALPPPDKPKKTWCEVLGVQAGAEPWLIEAAYKYLAEKLHPDAGGSKGLMAELNRARDEALKAKVA